MKIINGIGLKRSLIQSESGIWHNAARREITCASGAREGSSRSKRRVALADLRKLKTFFGGASGGCKGAKGAQPRRSVGNVNTTENQE